MPADAATLSQPPPCGEVQGAQRPGVGVREPRSGVASTRLPALNLRAIRFWQAVREEERLCQILAEASAGDRAWVEAAIAERRAAHG